MSDDYDVGYGKPPKHAQFQKGNSGNSNGRPKRSKNLNSIIKNELGEIVEIREGSRTHKVPKREAIIKRLVADSLAGKTAALRQLLALWSGFDELNNNDDADKPLPRADQKIIEAYLEKLQSEN